MEIIPGILETDWSEIEKKLELVRPFAKTVHVDLIDDSFAKTRTFFDPKPFKKYADDFLLELHMMVHDPLQYVEPFAAVGFKRFLGQVEHMPSQVAFVAKAQQFGEVGLAVDGKTPAEKITVPFIDLDAVLLLDIEAGRAGQSYHEAYAKKIKEVRAWDELLPISIDGGVTDENIVHLANLGATRFIANSFLFKDGNPGERFKELNDLLRY